MLHARGKVYVGLASRQSGSKRYVPSLSVELSGPPSGHAKSLRRLFGDPVERRYYGNPTWRYVTQDRERIAAIIAAVIDYLPAPGVLADMREFCTTTSNEEREKIATRLRAKS